MSETFEDWEAGCETDPMRNRYLIPAVSDVLKSLKPKSILDVGTATGYVARHVDSNLSYGPTWTLLDRNAQALSFARESSPSNMRASFVQSELSDFQSDREFGAILMTFTLLEIEDRSGLFGLLSSLLSDNGKLILAVPDCLQDVMDECRRTASLQALEEYAAGVVELDKIDKFTGQSYPFYAERVSSIISRALAVDLSLHQLDCEEIERRGVYLLVFGKTDQL